MGNQLAVIHDADGLADDVMQAMAFETKLSETTFVQSPTDEGADYRNRIFAMSHEMPFAGHPSLGTAVAVARARGDRSARYVQQTHAGLQPVDVEVAADGASGHASMLQEPAVFGPEWDPAEVMAAVGLSPADADPELPPQVVTTGLQHLMAPVASLEALGRLVLDDAAPAALLGEADATVLYLAFCEPDAGRARTRGILPVVAGMEDPGTGSAAGPLCCYLQQRTGVGAVTIVQGVEMGRRCEIEASLEGDRVRIGGDVAVLVDGTVAL